MPAPRLSPRRTTGLLHGLVAAAVLVAILSAGGSLLATWQGYSALPRWDEWTTVMDAQRLWNGKYQLSDLVRFHNEHRIAVSRLVALADYRVFGGTNVLDLAAVWILHGALIAILVAMIRDAARLGGTGTALVVAMLAAFFLQPRNLDNLAWSFQHCFPAAFFFGALALYAARRVTDSPDGARTLARELGWAAVAWIGGVAAAFSLANGLLALPLVLRWALWFRAPRWFTAGTAAVLLATVVVWLSGASLPKAQGSMAFGINRVVTTVAYLCATLGSPFSFGRLLPLAMTMGAVGLLLAVCVTARVVAARRRRPSQALLLMTGAYAFGAVTMVALGRSHFDMSSALAGRYLVPTGVVWICLLGLLWSMAPRWPARMGRAWGRPITAALVLVGLASVVGSARDARAEALRIGFANHIAEAMLLSGVTDDSVIKRVRSWPRNAERYLDVLRTHRLSIYHNQRRDSIGAELTPRAMRISGQPATCVGGISEIVPVFGKGGQLPLNGWSWEPVARRPGEFRVTGWAWDKNTRSAPGEIVLTDDDDRVVGEGALEPRSVARMLRSTLLGQEDTVGWEGFARIERPSRLRVYARASDGGAPCLLVESAIVTPDRSPTPSTSTAQVGNLEGLWIDDRLVPVNEVARGRAGARVRLSGWAIDPKAGSPAGGVLVVVDGREVAAAGHGIERADVAQSLQRDRYAWVGWAIELPKSLLTAGSHEVAVRVLTRDGAEYAEFPQKVRLQLE